MDMNHVTEIDGDQLATATGFHSADVRLDRSVAALVLDSRQSRSSSKNAPRKKIRETR